MVRAYRHTPGNHCGSTALRNLLAFHGVEISEEMAFGLGAGAAFYYVAIDEASPTRWFNGRAARLEENFLELTGAALQLQTFDQPDLAMKAALSQVDDGNPSILLTDLYYLDHYGKSAHFPGHAVVLAGYDDQLAYLSDTGFDELQTTRLENLERARHGDHPAMPLNGQMFVVSAALDADELLAAAPRAVERAALEMLEPPFGDFAGLRALDRFAADAAGWPHAAKDWQWCARFAYQVIERRGTGGGNFRLMYSRFLEQAGYEEAGLAAEAAAVWTELAEAFREASEEDEPEPALWQRIGELAGAARDAEQQLWTSLSAD